jgi:outer membrane protein
MPLPAAPCPSPIAQEDAGLLQAFLTPSGGGSGAARPWGRLQDHARSAPPPQARPALRPTTVRAVALAVALCGGLGLAPRAQAQTIQTLYDAARAFDATYLGARAQADAAQYERDQALALRRPSVGLSGGVARSGSQVPEELFGAQPDGERLSGRSYTTRSEVGLSASQPLYNRGNAISIDQAERAYGAALTELDAAEQDLILRLTEAYFNVLAGQDALSTARANKAAIAEQLASAKRNFEVGTATITDTREAQARFDLATAQEIGADNELRSARIVLDQLVGRSNVQPRPLLTPVRLPVLEPADVEAWVAQTGESPSVRRALLAYDIAQLEIEKAKAGHLPTVDLVGSYGRQRNTNVVNPSSSNFPGTFTSASVGVQLNVPLFAGYAVQNRIRETLALQEKARNDAEAAKRAVVQGTRQTFLGVQSGEARVRALEAAEGSSQLALEATQLGYKVGVRVNLDVLNAQTQLFTTQRDLARARYDVIVNHLQLRRTAGTLKPQDVDAVNRLLAP